MLDKVSFNKEGNLVAPEVFWKAGRNYWEQIEPLIDKLSIVELRALEPYLGVQPNLIGYMLRKQSRERKQGTK